VFPDFTEESEMRVLVPFELLMQRHPAEMASMVAQFDAAVDVAADDEAVQWGYSWTGSDSPLVSLDVKVMRPRYALQNPLPAGSPVPAEVQAQIESAKAPVVPVQPMALPPGMMVAVHSPATGATALIGGDGALPDRQVTHPGVHPDASVGDVEEEGAGFRRAE
jgi:hypothetical protein